MLASKIAMAAAGLGGTPLYVEDVFSTYLYTGDGSTPTITNGLDMSAGSLLWIKNRDATDSHVLVDTARGVGQILSTDSTAADTADADTVTAFGSTGFTLGADVKVNTTGESYVAWAFCVADNFFYLEEVTKVASTSKTVDLSSLGTVGMVIVKRTDSTGDWFLWHRSLTAGKLMKIATTGGESTDGSITVSGTTLTLVDGVIANGDYIVYAWAHDAGGFGADGAESIVDCGSFSYTPEFTTTIQQIDIGREPQWMLVKDSINSGTSSPWRSVDYLRAFTTQGQASNFINWDQNVAESPATNYVGRKADGFSFRPVTFYGTTQIYITIRIPMKVPEAGTEVYNAVAYTGDGATNRTITHGLTTPPDSTWTLFRAAQQGHMWWDLIRGYPTANTGTARYVRSTASDAEAGVANYIGRPSMTEIDFGSVGSGDPSQINGSGSVMSGYFWKRASKFMDIVCWTNGASPTTVNHNLTVIPELIIGKRRSAGTDNWNVYHKDLTYTDYLVLNGTDAAASNANRWYQAPTATEFYTGAAFDSAATYVAHLFATLAGVSKVGSYTGTAASLDLDMGFAAGARFFLCKRTDSTGDWYLFDSARGIVSGNDPYLLINSAAAEVTGTDYVDPLAAGLTLTAAGSATINISSATYIYLAIA